VGGAAQEARGEDGAQETQGGYVPADRVDNWNVSPDAAVHNFYKGMILDNIEAKMAAAEAAAATPPPEATAELAGASATSFASTPASASASASATEQPDRAKHDEVVVLDGPASTQDASSTSPNPFF
jgi:outer membrane scaffolding protein for murein synthesis (MipA/OmpV family)